MSRHIESFLRNVKQNPDGYTQKYLELASETENGEYPCNKCTICNDPDNCSKIPCICWYRWFQKHWQDIQKVGKAMK